VYPKNPLGFFWVRTRVSEPCVQLCVQYNIIRFFHHWGHQYSFGSLTESYYATTNLSENRNSTMPESNASHKFSQHFLHCTEISKKKLTAEVAAHTWTFNDHFAWFQGSKQTN